MKLNTLLKELLLEGILEAIGQKEAIIRDKWQRISDLSEMCERDIIYVNKVVPVSEELLQKIHATSEKYMGWILNLYKNAFDAPKIVGGKPLSVDSFKQYETRFAEDLYKIRDNLKIFAFDAVRGKITKDLNLSQPVTINNFQTADDLYQAVKPYTTRKFASNSDQAKHDTFVFAGDVFDVYVPTTKEQSCTLGGDTQWCTAAHGNDNRFDDYNSQGKLYILINRQNPTEKHQFHFEDGSFIDNKDIDISIEDILNYDKKLDRYFTPFLKEKYDKLILDDEYFNIIGENTYLLKYNTRGVEIRIKDGLPRKMKGKPIFSKLNCILDEIYLKDVIFGVSEECVDLPLYKNIESLTDIFLIDCNISMDVLVWINKLPNLKTLRLGGSTLNAQNFRFLVGTPIEYLDLTNIKLSNKKTVTGLLSHYYNDDDYLKFITARNLKDISFTDAYDKYVDISIEELKTKKPSFLRNSLQ